MIRSCHQWKVTAALWLPRLIVIALLVAWMLTGVVWPAPVIELIFKAVLFVVILRLLWNRQ